MPPPSSVVIVAGSGAVVGAALSGALGGAVASVTWLCAARTPEAAERAVTWGMMQGVLIGAAGLFTGALAAIAGATLAARAAGARVAVGVGAAIGAVVGAALGATLWDAAGGRPVAVASLVAHTVVGAVVAALARARMGR